MDHLKKLFIILEFVYINNSNVKYIKQLYSGSSYIFEGPGQIRQRDFESKINLVKLIYFYLFFVSVPNKYYLYICLYKYFSLQYNTTLICC
jgi:hypothetical protein